MILKTLISTTCIAIGLAAQVPFNNFVRQMPLTDRRKLVLDMDDTLYPISSGLRDALVGSIRDFIQQHVECSKEEANKLTSDYYKLYGLSLKGLIIEKGAKPDDYERFLDENIDYSVVPRDARLPALLAKANADIIIFTNSGLVHTRRTLTELEVINLVHLIVYTDYAEPDFPAKPNPIAYERVEKLLNVHPSQIYFADDNVKNIKVARERNWNTVQIDEGLSDAQVPTTTVIREIYDIDKTFPIIFKRDSDTEAETDAEIETFKRDTK